jgi:hypothetical protein
MFTARLAIMSLEDHTTGTTRETDRFHYPDTVIKIPFPSTFEHISAVVVCAEAGELDSTAPVDAGT